MSTRCVVGVVVGAIYGASVGTLFGTGVAGYLMPGEPTPLGIAFMLLGFVFGGVAGAVQNGMSRCGRQPRYIRD